MAEFDAYAQQYDADLNKGLRLSGEGRDFFAQGRVAAAAEWMAAQGIRPEHIVDFGCGTGNNIPTLLDAFPDAHVTGFDISAESVQMARERFADDARVDFASSPEGLVADWVYMNGVMHHVPAAEQDQVLAQVVRLARPGGAVTIFDNNPFNPGARLVMKLIPFDHNAKMVSPYRLRTGLSAAGLARPELHFLFVFPSVLAPLRRLEPALQRYPIGAQYGVFGRR